MRRATLLVGLTLMAGAPGVRAQGAVITWNRLDVTARLDNDGRVEVSEIHEMKIQGDVSVITRGFNYGVEQSALIHGVFRVEPDGSRKPLKIGPVSDADSYQAWTWGLQFSLRGEKDPPFEGGVQTRTYAIEYTLHGAITPAWDLAAGSAPLDDGTVPKNPFDRAREVWAGWQKAWPDLRTTYRFDHDVLFPSRGTTDSLVELNYHLEYDTAWVLLDKDRALGVATPDVDYRVQRLLRYLPAGAPKQANLEHAALRLVSVAAPLIFGLLLGALFLIGGRLTNPTPKGDRALFEARIVGLPPESIAARLGERIRAPSFEKVLTRMAAQKKIAIAIEAGETDDAAPLVNLRLTTDRARLAPFEREVVEGLFGPSDSVSTAQIQERHRGDEFNPNLLVSTAFDGTLPKTTLTRRPLVSALHLTIMAGGIGLMVKSLLEHTLADPAPIFGSVLSGSAIVGYWPAGSSQRRPSAFLILLAMTFLGLLGTTLALIPNTPLSGPASLGLTLLGVGNCVGYLARLHRSTTAELEFEAARNWALRELRRPRPALMDAWVEVLEALGGRRALARWKAGHGAQAFGGAPDMSEASFAEVVTGPPFTGEAPRPPLLTARWTSGFSVYASDSENEEEEDEERD
ncbi:MAG: DUF2207 domain-containing protein [Vicinamibacteria bacterium]